MRKPLGAPLLGPRWQLTGGAARAAAVEGRADGVGGASSDSALTAEQGAPAAASARGRPAARA